MPYSRAPWRRHDGTITSPSAGTVCHIEKTNPNKLADGRLILAAPILLETLIRVRATLADDHDLSTPIDAAIQQALGVGHQS